MGENDRLAETIFDLYVKLRVDEGVIFITYGELSNRLGRPGQHRLLGDPLDRLRSLCRKRGVPDISTVVVDKPSLSAGSVKPSAKALEKYGGWHGLRSEQARVMTFDWATQVP